MNTKVGHFPPAKRSGLLLHAVILFLLGSAAAWGFFNFAQAQVGPFFVEYLLVALLTLALIPFFGYRAYALSRADYYIDRDSLAILWGLRLEDIPLTDVEWVRPALNLTHPLRLPRFRLPGAVLGLRRHPELGMVEFIASGTSNLILVATAKRVFAISPKNANALVQTFARATELGSLAQTEAVSVYPSFILTQAWESSAARFLWISGLFLNIGLAVWVGLLIPSLQQIPFGFDPYGIALDTVPSTRLILLPLVSALMFLGGWGVGLYFFRGDRQRPLAFITWISSTLTSLLFLMAVLFLVTTPV